MRSYSLLIAISLTAFATFSSKADKPGDDQLFHREDSGEVIAADAHDRNHGPVGTCEVHAVPIEGPPPPSVLSVGPLNINPTFDATVTPARQAVLNEAISEWEAIVLETATTPNPYPISFTFTAFRPGSSVLAVTSVSYYVPSGNLCCASMSFNTNFTFYEDPNPATDDEFSGGSPPTGVDLLTVARHELGHAIGYADLPRVQALISGGAFDPPRMNIAWTTVGGGHTDPAWLPNDLMAPSLGASTRQAISPYPNASLIARAYQYVVPMRYVDPLFGGIPTGSASEPYQTLAAAMLSPSGLPLLLSNYTHHVPVNWTSPAGVMHTLDAARGGSIVVAP